MTTEEIRMVTDGISQLTQVLANAIRIAMQPLINLAHQIKQAWTDIFNRLRIRAGFSKVTFVRGRYQLVNTRFLLKRVKVVHAKPRTRKRR